MSRQMGGIETTCNGQAGLNTSVEISDRLKPIVHNGARNGSYGDFAHIWG